MEEQDVDALDDFFAKKDKKKKKSKSSKKAVADLLPAPTSTPPDETNNDNNVVVDQLADRISSDAKIIDSTLESSDTTSKEKKKSRKKKDKDGSDAASKDEEWHTQADEVDYTGLRIATKNIAQEAADEAAEAAKSEPEYDEDGQIIQKPSDGPVWKMAAPENPPVVQEVPTPVATPVIAEMPNVSGGKYVPPSRRAGATPALTPVSVKKTPRRKVAPNVNSQEDFPTLGAPPPPVDYDVANFEKVRGGSVAQPAQPQSGQSRLQTSNMYSALERN